MAKKQPPRKVRVAKVVKKIEHFTTSASRPRPTPRQRAKYK
jgi:hypothetical protein